ncbi:MAG: hypothetical protein RL557_864 [archaeon]|jgi:hypothetical protein
MKKLVALLLIVALIPFIAANVVINEFAVDPQTDWDESGGAPGTDDEFIELYNDGALPVNVTGWTLSLIDTTPESQILSGIIPAGGFLVIQNPTGIQNNDGQIILSDLTLTVVDSVTYGTHNDGNVADNADDGNSAGVSDECLARMPNGVDTGVDMNDFVKIACTFEGNNDHITFSNEVEPLCAIQNSDIELRVDVTGTDIDDVWISYTVQGGVNVNQTAGKVLGTDNTYAITIDSSALTMGNLLWRAYANDSDDIVFDNDAQTLYVHGATQLTVAPVNPDGENSWYVTEPLFSLSGDTTDLVNRFYEWDSDDVLLYSGLFGLDDIPNAPPKEAAGVLELNWWSEFSCGEEMMNTRMFSVDLTSPVITNLVPAENSIVNIAQPLIAADIDEVYQSNSGVDELSVVMKVDDVIVTPVVTKNALDAHVMYTPPSDLSEGVHTALIEVDDIAGRHSTKTWQFTVESSTTALAMSVYSPTDALYVSRRIQANISLNKIADAITYLDNGKERTLCRHCDNYGVSKKKFLSLQDGTHLLKFRAIEGSTIVEQEVSVVIDSKEPHIKKIRPSHFSNGLFEIEFTEENPASITLYYGNQQQNVPLTDCDADGDDYTCMTTADVSSYNSQEIEYWFSVEDIAGRVDTSKREEVTIDTTVPVLNELDYTIDDTKVHFFFDVTEINFDRITFVENMKEKNLCTTLKDGMCDKKRTFTHGTHTITIKVQDDAGNVVSEELTFTV